MQVLRETIATSPMQGSHSSLLSDGCQTAYSALERYETATWESGNGSLSPKYTALIAMAVSLAIPCERSAHHYRQQALQVGASSAELVATALAAAALRAGGALAYGRLGFKFLDHAPHDATSSAPSSLAKDREYMTQLRKASIPAFNGLAGLRDAVHKEDFPLSKKHFELVAFAVALTTQCVYCVDLHINDARKFGAGDQEIADTVHIAGCVRARSTLLQAEDILDSDAA